MSTTLQDLQEVLAVEDASQLMDIKCTSTELPLWPLVRNRYLREILSDLLYDNVIPQSGSSRSASAKAIGTLTRGSLHNLTSPVKAPQGVCIMASGVGLQRKDNRWFNRLSDHFALLAPQVSCLIEDRFDWIWPFPRHFSNVMFHAPYQAAGAVYGRLRVTAHHRKQAEGVVELVDERAKRHLGWALDPVRRTSLLQSLAAKAAAMPFMFSTYRRLLAATEAKLLIKEEACYGTSAVVIAAARSLGMATAEYQHGAITAGHDAYSFAPAILESDAFRKCLPDCFLGYGQWWLEQFNAPVEKVVIGNPHREAKLAAIDGTQPKTCLLVVGDGIDTEMFLNFAAKLLPSAKQLGLQVVFRPHPMERHLFENGASTTQGVAIDTEKELYQSLASARAVIGEASTVLFEASGLTDAIFVWNTAKSRFYLPNHPFKAISDADQVAAELKNGVPAITSSSSNAIWAGGWRQNYLAFLQRFGIQPA